MWLQVQTWDCRLEDLDWERLAKCGRNHKPTLRVKLQEFEDLHLQIRAWALWEQAPCHAALNGLPLNTHGRDGGRKPKCHLVLHRSQSSVRLDRNPPFHEKPRTSPHLGKIGKIRIGPDCAKLGCSGRVWAIWVNTPFVNPPPASP